MTKVGLVHELHSLHLVFLPFLNVPNLLLTRILHLLFSVPRNYFVSLRALHIETELLHPALFSVTLMLSETLSPPQHYQLCYLLYIHHTCSHEESYIFITSLGMHSSPQNAISSQKTPFGKTEWRQEKGKEGKQKGRTKERKPQWKKLEKKRIKSE